MKQFYILLPPLVKNNFVISNGTERRKQQCILQKKMFMQILLRYCKQTLYLYCGRERKEQLHYLTDDDVYVRHVQYVHYSLRLQQRQTYKCNIRFFDTFLKDELAIPPTMSYCIKCSVVTKNRVIIISTIKYDTVEKQVACMQ